MKQRILFLFTALTFYVQPELCRADTSPVVSFNSETEIMLSQKSVFDSGLKYNSGIRLSFPAAVFSFSAGIDKTLFSELTDYSLKEFYDVQKIRWGAQHKFSSKLTFFSAELFAGTLKYSGAASRLKSPAISQARNALSAVVGFSHGLLPSLPSFTSGVYPVSYALSLKKSNRTKNLPEMDFYYSPGNSSAFSVYSSFSSELIPDFSLGFTGGIFSHGFEKTVTSWTLSRMYYPEKMYAAFECEGNITFQSLRFSFCASAFENPYGTLKKCVRTQASFLTDSFSIDGALYFSDPNLIASDGSLENVTFQFYINPKFSVSLVPGTFYFGAYFGEDFLNTKDRLYSPYRNIYGKAGVRFHRKKTDVSFYYSDKISTLDKSRVTSFRTKFSSVVRRIKTSVSGTYKQEGDKKTYSSAVSLCPQKSSFSSFSFNAEKASSKTELSSSLVFSGGSRKFRWNVKFSLLYRLLN